MEVIFTIGSYIYCLIRVHVNQSQTVAGRYPVKGLCQLYILKKQFKTRTRSRAPVKTERLMSYCRLALNEATDIPNRKGVVSLIVLTFSDQKQAFFHGGTTCRWLKEFFSLFSCYSPMKPPAYNKHTCTLKSISNKVHSTENRFYLHSLWELFSIDTTK